MDGVIWTLARNPLDPEATSPVTRAAGAANLRLIFTTPFPRDIPSYRILYRVEDDDATVTLLYVDLDPDAEESDIIG